MLLVQSEHSLQNILKFFISIIFLSLLRVPKPLLESDLNLCQFVDDMLDCLLFLREVVWEFQNDRMEAQVALAAWKPLVVLDLKFMAYAAQDISTLSKLITNVFYWKFLTIFNNFDEILWDYPANFL